MTKEEKRAYMQKYRKRDAYKKYISSDAYAENRRKYWCSGPGAMAQKKKHSSEKYKVAARERMAEHAKTLMGRYGSYKKSAKSRGLEFDLTIEQFKGFWKAHCHYCGDRIETIGLDRRDSKIGYILGNIVPCCWTCNKAKSAMSDQEFVDLCRK